MTSTYGTGLYGLENVLHFEKCPDTRSAMMRKSKKRSISSMTVDDSTVTIVFAPDDPTAAVSVAEDDEAIDAAIADMQAEEAAEVAAEAAEEAVEAAEEAVEAAEVAVEAAAVAEEALEEIQGDEDEDEGERRRKVRKGPAARVFRTGFIELMDSSPDDRRVALAFSSEAEVDRGWGIEVLDHSSDALNAEFIGSGRAPLLLEHDPAEQVGVVEAISVGADRMARAVVRFGRTARAEEILADVRDGIRSSVSVGYIIDEMKLDEVREGGREVYRATRWTPLEISLVSIPADMNVGVGRALDATTIHTTFSKETFKMSDKHSSAADAAGSERARASAILELGARHNQRDFAEAAVRDGASIEQFRGALLDKVGSKPLATAEIGMTEKEKGQFSFVRAIRAMANPTDKAAVAAARFEFEASEAAAAKEGRVSRGITVPMDVLMKRDILTGTATNTAKGGNTVATDLLAGSFIDVLRNRMVVSELGATFLTGLQGNVAIPKKTAPSTVAWVAENAAPSESTNTPSFGQVTLSPKTLAGYVDFSRRLMLQSSLDIEALIRDDLATTIAVAMDGAAIAGSGTNRPTGVLNTAGIGSVTLGTNGLAPTWQMVVDLVKEVEIDNARTGAAAFLTNAQVKSRLARTPRQNSGIEGNFILQPPFTELYGERLSVSQQVPGNLTKGSGSNLSAMIFGVWSDLLIGQWSGIDLLVYPYTGSNAATVRVTAFHDCDFAVRYPESFAECNEIVTT